MRKNIIFFIAILSLLACEQTSMKKPSKHSIVYVVVDQTESFNVTSPLKANDILNLTEVNCLKGKYNSCLVYLTTISDISFNQIEKFHLPKGSFFENNYNREDTIKAFRESLDRELAKEFSIVESKGISSVYLSINRILKELNNKEADQKLAIIYSDLFENNNAMTTSFYKYISNPKMIMKFYDEISKSFEEIEPLPSLNGIDIIVVYNPTVRTDALFIQSKKFWTRYFLSKGANIKFLANID